MKTLDIQRVYPDGSIEGKIITLEGAQAIIDSIKLYELSPEYENYLYEQNYVGVL